jgi:hypothetical protein
MPFQDEFKRWLEELSIAFPTLNAPQITVLALYSLGMIWTRQCGQTVISVFLAKLFGKNANNQRQQLREWTYETKKKRGKKRREVEVYSLFGALFRWVIGQWLNCSQVTLAFDVTYLKDQWMILCISVLYGKTAIPVAWRVLPGNQSGEWNPIWQALVDALVPAIPPKVKVSVLFDRGLYSKTLFLYMVERGWQVFMRVRTQGFVQRIGRKTWLPLSGIALKGMEPIAIRAICFKNQPLECVLWVRWDNEYDEPCLVISNMLPRQVKGNPYPLRMWIEAGFRQWKRGGFHWEHAKINQATRMERLLLVVAVAQLYLVRQGQSEQEVGLSKGDPAQLLGLATLGWVGLLARMLNGEYLAEAYFRPYILPPFYPVKKTYP